MSYALGELHKNLSYKQYSDTCTAYSALRASYLKTLKKSPAHLFEEITQKEDRDTEFFRQGRIVHKFLENPEKFLDTCLVEPEFKGKTKDGRDSARSAESKQLKEAWYAQQDPKKTIIKKDDVPLIQGISRSIRGHTVIRNLLKEGVSETSLWIKDPETGVVLACRPDFIAKAGFVVDVKTTRNAGREFFTNQIFSDRYDSPQYILQAAHYANCLAAAGFGRSDSFAFIAVEKEPPYCLNLFALDDYCLDVGRKVIKKLTRIYADCLEKNVWPGYADVAIPVGIPNWVMWEEEDA